MDNDSSCCKGPRCVSPNRQALYRTGSATSITRLAPGGGFGTNPHPEIRPIQAVFLSLGWGRWGLDQLRFHLRWFVPLLSPRTISSPVCLLIVLPPPPPPCKAF